jgi:mannose-6-phosphate isomerase-like protein (cupin superfamily)
MNHTPMEWIANTPDVRVRVMTLAPGAGTPWHFHHHVTDFMFGLDDGVTVSLRDPDTSIALGPGQRCDVPPGRVHRVLNGSDHPARYLLVQATGEYDFVEVNNR